MIAIDSSVIVAIAWNESGHLSYERRMAAAHTLVGAPTLLEVHCVLRGRGGVEATEFIDEFLRATRVEVVAAGAGHFATAREAFDRYGKGRGHPARLNFGDCLSYAVAKVAGVPLLFAGDDFRHTDIQPALHA